MAAVIGPPAAVDSLAASQAPAVSHQKLRKRKTDDVETEEKPRGRPRKNSKDESAAERRRTQIRLAQRAYRQRKETTIDELRQKVNELTGALETVDRRLRDFTATAQHTSLSPQAVKELDNLLQQLAPVFAVATSAPRTSGSPPGSDSGGAADADRHQERVHTQHKEPMYDPMLDNPGQNSMTRPTGMVLEEVYPDNHYHQARPIPLPHHQRNPQTIAHHPPPPPQDTPQHHGHHQLRHAHDSRSPQYPSQRHYTQEQISQAYQSRQQVSMLDAGLYTHTMMAQSRTITPIQTISNYERSFARRLQRICIEAGYELLLDPSKAPNSFQRVFKLLLATGSDRHELSDRFALAIKRDMNSNLDSSVSPFSNIGGAGLHYPDQSGCRRPELGNAQERVALDALAASIPGLSGEWLDTNDVQGYLHELGVKVDGTASFIHASVPVELLSSPPDRIEVDAHLARSSRYHNFEDVEDFHTRFEHLDDQMEASPHKFSPFPIWDPTAAAAAGIDLSLLPPSIPEHHQGAYYTPLPPSYPLQPAHLIRDDSSTTASGSADSQTFSPPPLGGKADSVSSAEDNDGGVGFAYVKHVAVTVDVCKLLKVLLLSSVCLGRAPGFRRWHVEAAVRSSIVPTL